MADMAVHAGELPKGVSFEDAWALIRETGQLIKELTAKTDRQQEETGRLIKELTAKTDRQQEETGRQMRETDRKMRETDRKMQETGRQMQETDRKMRETDRRLGELGLRLGELAEHLMSPKLHEKFESLGFCFNHSSRNHELHDHNKQRLAEIDVLLENGDYAMAVEVKTHLKIEDVQDHLKRMDILRRVADAHQDARKYLGAVAGAVLNPEVIRYALKQGFYVIRPSGETVAIEVPQGFKPRLW
jgi:hypothetical protein